VQSFNTALTQVASYQTLSKTFRDQDRPSSARH
jgi:hypothetical protein